MHTIKMIAGGFLLLAVTLLLCRWMNPTTGWVLGAKIFLPLWFVGAGVNMRLGVKAGYTVAEEAPIFLVVFAIPAVFALLVWWLMSRG